MPLIREKIATAYTFSYGNSKSAFPTIWNICCSATSECRRAASRCFCCEKSPLTTTAEHSVISLSDEKAWSDEKNFPDYLKKEVFIKHKKGPLFFGSTSKFQQLPNQIPETASTVIIRMGRMQYMDQSGLYAMEDMLQELKKSDVEVLFVGLLKQPRYMMERIDIIPDFIPNEHIFRNFKECMAWISLNFKNGHKM